MKRTRLISLLGPHLTQLSEHAKTGWKPFFEDKCTSLQLPAADLARAIAAPTQLSSTGMQPGNVILFVPTQRDVVFYCYRVKPILAPVPGAGGESDHGSPTTHKGQATDVHDEDTAAGSERAESIYTYSCQKVRQHDPTAATNSATCSQIWHELWGGGANIPPGLKTIRLRAPAGQGAQASDRDDNVPNDSSSARSGSDGGSPTDGGQ